MTSSRSEPTTPRARYCSETAESVALAQALSTILPQGVVYAAAETVSSYEPSLVRAEHAQRYPDEAELVRSAVPKRLFEFLAARELARQLLVIRGQEPVSIPRGPLGAPTWPFGIVGTIAHSSGMVVVALANASDFSSLGVDLEPNLPLPEGVESYVSLPDENESAPAARAVFVAKEAFYKAHAGIHQRILDFTDVRVRWEDGGFHAEELAPPDNANGPTSSWGSIAVTAGWLAAFCAIRQ